MNAARRLVPIIIALLISSPAGCLQNARKTDLERHADRMKPIEEFWPNGTPRLRKEAVAMPDGSVVPDGIYTRWHDNGRKEYEVRFDMGKKDGIATSWHKNGRKWIEEHYTNGMREGPRIIWDENGLKRKEEFYVDGKPDGTWTVWEEDGEIEAQSYFDHGVPKP